jgi:hypothetical protein
MSQFRRMCRTYSEAYRNKLTSRKVPADLQASLDNCEKIMDVFNIVLIRQKIEVEVIENKFFIKSAGLLVVQLKYSRPLISIINWFQKCDR